MASGWFSDPLGRHEKRFYNGLVWTDRVMDGGYSRSDPIGNVAPAMPFGPVGRAAVSGLVDQPSGGNAPAITAVALGILGAVVAVLVPFGFLVGAVCGVVAVVLGLRGFRNLTGNGDTSNALATSGLMLGSLALIVAVYLGAAYYGFATTVRHALASSTTLVVTDASASRDQVVVTNCYRAVVGAPTATGTIVNTADKKQSFRVTIEFRAAQTKVHSSSLTVPLAPGETGRWTVRDIDVSFKPASCSVVSPAAVTP
jgi:hypothetical protein